MVNSAEYDTLPSNTRRSCRIGPHFVLTILLALYSICISIFFFRQMILNSPLPPVNNRTIIPVVDPIEGKYGGAWQYQHKKDFQSSIYFKELNLYSQKPSKTLTILKNFKTYQQTSETSCGVASTIMALSYLKPDNYSENEIAKEMGTNEHGTSPKNLTNIIKKLGFQIDTNYGTGKIPEYLEFVQYAKEQLNLGHPIIILSSDWGGHYAVLIGYDDMGTEYDMDDIFIFADPYDTTDHRQDGFVVWPSSRFYSIWGVPIPYAYDENVLRGLYFTISL